MYYTLKQNILFCITILCFTTQTLLAQETFFEINTINESNDTLLVDYEILDRNAGLLTDSRDGRQYRTVKIGEQVWMAQNLAYKPPKGKIWVYKKEEDYISQFGYLYKYSTAINQSICPCGWRIPTPDDYLKLLEFCGGSGYTAYIELSENGKSGFANVNFIGHGGLQYIYDFSQYMTCERIGKQYVKTLHAGNSRYPSAKMAYYLIGGGFPVRCIKMND